VNKIVLAVVLSVAAVPCLAQAAKTSPKITGPNYPGQYHTTSHGGHYLGGVGSSHKGGHYESPSLNVGNHYGHHKPNG